VGLAADLAELWGDAITRLPTADAEMIGLPDEARGFLATVGLPRESLLTRIDLTYTTPLLHAHKRGAPACRVIGETRPVGELCLELATGTVMIAHSRYGIGPSLINTGPIEFAACLCTFERFLRAYGDTPSGEHSPGVVDDFERALIRIDPEALADSNGFWAQAVEEQRYGM
jgi:hypothetical protein